jgi:hypothetical protein
VPVQVLTLDVPRTSLNHCDLLKLDNEGAEYETRFNAKDETIRIDKISMEYHLGLNDDHTPDKLVDCLESHGFAVKLPRR